jgi:transcriptional regulator with XRE-family HTH domain
VRDTFFNQFVGQKIRIYRKLKGLTLGDIAAELDLSYQQVQKYEKGESRISAFTLHRLALILGINLNDFMKDYPSTIQPYMLGDAHATPTPLVISDAERDKLIVYFSRITNAQVREKIILLLKTLCDD